MGDGCLAVNGIVLTPSNRTNFGPDYYTADELAAKKSIVCGRGVAIHKQSKLDSHARLTFGDNVVVCRGVTILCHDASTLIWGVPDKFKGVKVGSNVFIGQEAIILRGVTIGDNVVIGAGSVVTKDVPSGSVYAGNPAKFIKSIEEYLAQYLPENTASGGNDDTK